MRFLMGNSVVCVCLCRRALEKYEACTLNVDCAMTEDVIYTMSLWRCL